MHTVDLVRALGVDEAVEPELAATVLDWFAPMEELMEDMYRRTGE